MSIFKNFIIPFFVLIAFIVVPSQSNAKIRHKQSQARAKIHFGPGPNGKKNKSSSIKTLWPYTIRQPQNSHTLHKK